MAGRLSHSSLQVLLTETASGRLSHVILQVLELLPSSISPADDLDNWNDAVVVEAPVDRTFTDSLDNWADNAVREFLIFTVALDVNVSDWLSKSSTHPQGKNLKDSWKDGLMFFMDAADVPLGLSIEDLALYANDSVQLSLGLLFSDTLSLSDFAKASTGINLEAYDSNHGKMLDAVAISYLLSTSITDSFTLSDAIAFLLYQAIVANDSITFSDELLMQLHGFKEFSDTLSLSDAYSISRSGNPVQADDMNNLSDGVSIGLTGNLTITVGDDMDNMVDAFDEDNDLLLSGSDISYLRRYLNDVQ